MIPSTRSLRPCPAAGRSGAPPRLSGALAATLGLSLPAVLFALVPGASRWLELDRAALAAGELWRVVTCHWTHWTTDHLAWDLGVFLVLVPLSWKLAPRSALVTLVASSVAIPIAVWAAMPEMNRYRGLSGLDSALFVLVSVIVLRGEIAAGRRPMALAIGLLMAGFVAKVGFEAVTSGTLFADSTGFVPVPLAHLVGGACGWLAAPRPRRR